MGWSTVRRVGRRAWFAVVGLLLMTRVVAAANYTSLDLGAYATNVVKAPVAGGSLYNATAYQGYLRFRRGWHLGRDFHFEPSYGLALPWRGGVDGGLRILTSQLDLSVGFPLFSWLRLRAGPGVHWTFFWPAGEERRLNNGTGEANFWIPSVPAHVFLMTLTTGLEWRVTRGISVGLDVIFLQLLSRDLRRANAALTMGVVL